MEPFKNLYSLSFYNKFSDVLLEIIPDFNKDLFLKQIYTSDFEDKELKERMRHTTLVLHRHLPQDFCEAMTIFELMICKFRQSNMSEFDLVFMFLPDYIEVYGIDDYDMSIKAFEMVTQFITCEFAVRPFILKYGDPMIEQMIRWSSHENHQVRRLASEGSRPRLPWAMALPFLKADPKPILPILENMKNDLNESVRRSVANNLNDIAKDHPNIVVEIAKQWKGISKETDAIVKHGCRTLLKQAHPEVLKLYGLDSENIRVEDIKIAKTNIRIGEELSFSFEIENKQSEPQVIRLEYGLYYQKANGTLSRKVFKISERKYQPFEKAVISRNQSFKIITTRQLHLGKHKVSIIANGKEMGIASFQLVD